LDSADSRQHGFADAIGSTATVPAMDQNQIRLVNRSGVNPGARILLHLALAALPLLAISAQVFGLLTMRIAAGAGDHSTRDGRWHRVGVRASCQ
jgi:aryl-alcohol dehydrogenase-like predicted oxidoreductase